MKDIDMRPYDGIDYRYTSSDFDKENAIVVVKNILGFTPEAEGLDFSLNFFSGGVGVDDRLAIRCKFNPADWSLAIGKLNLKPPMEVLSNSEWGVDFAWLVSNDETPSDIGKDCCSFVNANRWAFQDVVSQQHSLLFADESNVNTWSVVWVVGDKLNYLGFDQG